MNVVGKSILIFGDSLSVGSYSPGGMFASYLYWSGAKDVRQNAKVSRSAYSYFTREDRSLRKLAKEVARNPDIVFIIMGTNEIGHNLKDEQRRYEKLRDAFPRAIVWGIGPPSLPSVKHKIADVVTMMARVFGSRFIDMRPLTDDMTSRATGRAHDGVHFTVAGAGTFAKRLARALNIKSKITKRPKLPTSIGMVGFGLALIIARRDLLMNSEPSENRTRTHKGTRA